MRHAAIVALAVLAGLVPAAAEERAPDPAQAHRVVDVAAGDTLNVRDQAGTASPVVGTLSHATRDVIVTGLRMTADQARWWEIVHPAAPRGFGWVNARFLAQADGAEAAIGFPLHCRGNEPFWSLAVDGEQAVLSTPDRKEPPWRAGRWQDAGNHPPGHRFAIRLESAGQAGWATVSRVRDGDFCSDHMSDFEYPYDATLIAPDGRVLAGCCTRAR